jgi:hypothetical protein
MNGSSRESVRANAPDHIDVHHNVKCRRRKLHSFEKRVPIRNGAEVAYA